MSNITKIQWCDSTVNPIMGCGGCELFPTAAEVLGAVDAAVAGSTGGKFDSRKVFKALVDQVFLKSENPNVGHRQAVNVTNIWHLRERFLERVAKLHGGEASEAAGIAIRKQITCYAATLHLNKGANILDREGARSNRGKARTPHPGYAPIFESVTRFGGRAADAAGLPDLLGHSNPATPWKDRLPRMIFVSDMGDALSAKADFPFLKSDLMPAIRSEAGQRHLWLWLTKRPERMAEFSREIGGFPPHVCAMTTVTSPGTLGRVDELRQVEASIRGLSLEPLWERIPPDKLDLEGIDWVIVGGESGSGDLTRPFALEWAEELRDRCSKEGVAFFLKQLGRNPSRNGKVFKLKDKHGGNWDEWEEPLRIRGFPKAFHAYRAGEPQPSGGLRPAQVKKGPRNPEAESLTPGEKAEFRRLDKIVRKGVAAFMECGKALREIHDKKLWRAGGQPTWESYCREVAGMSKPHANRLMLASGIAMELSGSLPIGNGFPGVCPVAESQVRPLHRLSDPEQRRQAWAGAVAKAGGQPTAAEVAEVVFEILAPQAPQEIRPTRARQRADLLERLKKAIGQRKSWDAVEKLLLELELLI